MNETFDKIKYKLIKSNESNLWYNQIYQIDQTFDIMK